MDQLYDTEPGQPRVPLRATPEGYLIVQIAGGGGGGGSSVTNLTTTVSPTNVVVASDTGTDATIPLADVTNAGAMPPAAVQQLAGLGTASEADVGDFAAAGHTHTLLMTTDERTKLGALPAAADLSISLAGKMANTLPAMQTAFSAGTAPEKAAFQASVSGATLRQVATRCSVPHNYASGPRQSMSSTRHIAMSGFSSIQLVYANWYVTGNVGEVLPGGAMTVKASIKTGAGTVIPVTFSGAATGSCGDGANIVSDPIAVPLRKGERFTVFTWTDNPSGAVYGAIPQSASNVSFGDYFNLGVTSADKTDGSAITNNVSGAAYYPCAIIGVSSDPAAALFGDSRVVGATDGADNGLLNFGDIAPAVGHKMAYINLARGGDTVTSALTSSTRRRALAAAYCTQAYVGYGINDLILRTLSASAVNANLTSFLALIAPLPAKLLTITPVSSSTDLWTTTANQTTHATNANRVAVNSSIRLMQLVGQAGFVEIADVVETARGSGIWQAPSGVAWTADGTHSNQASDIAIFNATVAKV